MPALPPFGQILASVCTGGILCFVTLLFRARWRFYHDKVEQGLPMPKWNPILGHLLVSDEVFKKFSIPPDIHRPDLFHDLSRSFDKESDSLFYMDLWPFINPLLLVSSPTYALQTCQQTELGTDRPDDLVKFLHPIAGGNSVFSSNGAEWKHARGIFSSGFNNNYILQQTEHIVQEAEVYVETLKEKAKRDELFLLDDITIKYTMDISGALTLNQRLNAQREGNDFVRAIRHTLDWHYLGELRSPLLRYSPLMGLICWYNGRTMNNFISKKLDERFQAFKVGKLTQSATQRSAIDLALTDYMSTHKDKMPESLDPQFKQWATAQLRLMFFVAHDSTSPTICYAFYLLSKNPSALQKVREEHDEVFGKDISAAPALLRSQPQLLNKLPYTTAVLKETLRLFTPASGFRKGKPDVDLISPNGKRYPTKDTRVWVLHSSLHRNPNYWPRPTTFIPERYLVGPEDPLYPVNGAWRPFERGPRDCLGQSLAMLDLKITLVMVVRAFDFKDAYEEFDKIHNIPSLRICTFQGERAYQRGHGGAHPADGLPCRVSLRR